MVAYAHIEVGLTISVPRRYFQAKAALTTISSNVFFNGPRSAINFNDGFGGGNVVDRNAIWNVCRQSGDHGPINSWDRQAYRTPLRDPSGGWAPLPTVISRNAIIANYGPAKGGSQFDLNGDGMVDSHDVIQALIHWGDCDK